MELGAQLVLAAMEMGAELVMAAMLVEMAVELVMAAMLEEMAAELVMAAMLEEMAAELVMVAMLALGWGLNHHIADRVHSRRIHLCICHNLISTCGTNLTCHCRNHRSARRTCSSLHHHLPLEMAAELVMAAMLEEMAAELVMAAMLALDWGLNHHIADRVHSRRIHLCICHNLISTCGTNLTCHCRNHRSARRTCSSLHHHLPLEMAAELVMAAMLEEMAAELVMAAMLALDWGLNHHIADRVHCRRIHLCICHNLISTCGTNLTCHCRNHRSARRTCSSPQLR
eukprot:TRINITY_DN2314_c0_g1_i6.p2 TRINITY_DN2314_c0_g1~~TRINITY_DN2314_c0_g1_i6.p2  ORF type:complete len:285 (+),score=39.07 TRINITY_DN2314_c0_g1_i6:373-1227(+)